MPSREKHSAIQTRRRQAYSLIETLIAMSLLSLFVLGTLMSIPMVKYRILETGLRSSVVLAMESSMETLRGVGYEDLEAKLVWNGVPGNGVDEVWEYDPVVGGELASQLVLRRSFANPAGGLNSPELWTEDTTKAIVAGQTCSLISAGTETIKSERFLRVTLTTQWTYAGRNFQETLYTIIEH